MDKLQLLAMVQAYTGIGVGLMIGLGAASFIIGLGIAMFFAFANPLATAFR